MQIGLLGKANVGKSTFFSAATQTPVQTGNFPFTTIQPNVGVAYITTDCACRHFDIKHQNPLCVDGTRLVPIKLIDIAGLVPGAHKGKGLGNQFLDDARQASALIHVVDIAGTTDIQGQPVPVGSHDPLEDVKFVVEEFEEWFKQILKREWDKLTREVEQKTTNTTAAIAKRFSGLGIKEHQVQQALQRSSLASKIPKNWTDQDINIFVGNLRRMTKPIIIAANKADLCKDLSIIKRTGEMTIPCSAETELLLRKASKSNLVTYVPGEDNFAINNSKEITAQQKKALLLVKDVFSKIGTTGIQKTLNAAVFDVLEMIVVYPVEDETRLCNKDGQVLPDAKLLPKGSTARDLAREVHEDIAKGFLYGIDCKTKQRIGADHVLSNGDVIKVVSATGKG